MGIGMFLLNFSSPKNFQPFILVSVITSAALIPILLTKKKPPTFKRIQAMSIKNLYEASPLGFVSSFFYGTIQSALFTLLAVYATSMNFTILEVSIVTFLLAVSGAVAQFPVGKISDVYDRRKVIIASTFGAAIFAIIAIFVSGQMYLPDGLATGKTWFYIFFILFSFSTCPATRITKSFIIFISASVDTRGIIISGNADFCLSFFRSDIASKIALHCIS